MSDYAMGYTRAGWEALVEAVEKDGGALLPEAHMPELVEYTGTQVEAVPHNPSQTCGCKKNTKVVLQYEPDEKFHVSNSGFLPVCAICDGVGAWPRFEDAVRSVSPDYWNDLEWEKDDDSATD